MPLGSCTRCGDESALPRRGSHAACSRMTTQEQPRQRVGRRLARDPQRRILTNGDHAVASGGTVGRCRHHRREPSRSRLPSVIARRGVRHDIRRTPSERCGAGRLGLVSAAQVSRSPRLELGRRRRCSSRWSPDGDRGTGARLPRERDWGRAAAPCGGTNDFSSFLLAQATLGASDFQCRTAGAGRADRDGLQTTPDYAATAATRAERYWSTSSFRMAQGAAAATTIHGPGRRRAAHLPACEGAAGRRQEIPSRRSNCSPIAGRSRRAATTRFSRVRFMREGGARPAIPLGDTRRA